MINPPNPFDFYIFLYKIVEEIHTLYRSIIRRHLRKRKKVDVWLSEINRTSRADFGIVRRWRAKPTAFFGFVLTELYFSIVTKFLKLEETTLHVLQIFLKCYEPFSFD